MGRYWQWIGTTTIALIAIAVSAPPIFSSWPRWVILTIGIALLVAVGLTFPRSRRRNPSSDTSAQVAQSQKAGDNSRLVQGRDITIEGRLGDHVQK